MEIFHTLLFMLNEMSPYILLGFLIAGLLHAFVPSQLMSRHLSGSGIASVIKAAIFGIPLPLCSCGVLPAAVALRRNGASKAASTSFLIATPQTGIDSIAATWSLLGPAFAVVRPVAALVTAIAGGSLAGATERKEKNVDPDTDKTCASDNCNVPASFAEKIKETFRYGFYIMVQSIGGWLVTGLIIAALITIFVPTDLFAGLGKHPLPAMLAVVIVAVPMYICATGSIPIALSLILKGLSPGTALVLLMAGPAANFASITVISRAMGRRNAAIYLGSIIAGAIAFGLCIDYLLPHEWFVPSAAQLNLSPDHSFSIFSTICSAILVALLVISFLPRFFKQHHPITDMTTEYKIKGMSCAHCKASVEKNLALVPGVTSVSVNLSKGIATVEGQHDRNAVIEKIKDLGFEPC